MFKPKVGDDEAAQMLASLKVELEKLVSNSRWELVKAPTTIQASVEVRALLINAIKKLDKCK